VRKQARQGFPTPAKLPYATEMGRSSVLARQRRGRSRLMCRTGKPRRECSALRRAGGSRRPCGRGSTSPESMPTRCAACPRQWMASRHCQCRMSAPLQWTNFCPATDHPRRLRRQRLPAGNGPGTGTRMLIVPDAGKQPAKLDSSRQIATLLIGDTDRGSLRLGNDKHPRIMAGRATAGKRIVSAGAQRNGGAGVPPVAFVAMGQDAPGFFSGIFRNGRGKKSSGLGLHPLETDPTAPACPGNLASHRLALAPAVAPETGPVTPDGPGAAN